jgi:hypothetical protein
MNAFYDHHKDSISWHYRCFDRILLNGLIQPFQQPERVLGFFYTYRQLYPVTRVRTAWDRRPVSTVDKRSVCEAKHPHPGGTERAS